MPRYNPAVIEPRWQRYWETNRTFAAPRLPQGEKLYVLDMFPYPSGSGLHVGHPEGYTATDIVCRYSRMKGKSVLHPMGWDAFGLPAEQHAIKTGTPPRQTTEKNIATFRRQLKMLGFSYDWDREFSTTDVEYFRWTQWIFLQIYDTWFDHAQQKGRPISELPIPADVRKQGEDAVRDYQDEHRLAYQLEAPVNWCPALGTVLANEEVIGGLSERGSHPVVRIPLRQWMLRITAYADRLEKDLETLDWTESIKALQRNWIGRSTGAEVDFFIASNDDTDLWASTVNAMKGERQWKEERWKQGWPAKPDDQVLRIYTTRPDTLYGATYMVIAPEHPMIDRLTTPDWAERVKAYREQASRKSELDRTDLAKTKSGVPTGSWAVNPVNGETIPIWTADYVVMGYGTGAIMAVPAHDERDFEFAQAWGLPIKCVVDPSHAGADESGTPGDKTFRAEVLAGKKVYSGRGMAVNSGQYEGLMSDEFRARIVADLAKEGTGRVAVNYKLRDWLFSRQHFWGEPFPVLHELKDGKQTGATHPLTPDDLPVNLPDLVNYKPHGRPEPPLEESPESWLYLDVDGKQFKRETNTMPQWAGSCWYYLRFLDPKNNLAFVDPAIEQAWMPVDLYIGGAEHAVLHLLYARFWHKVLYDRGLVSTVEPFQKLVNQGMILGEMEMTGYQRADGTWASSAHATTDDAGQPIDARSREPLTRVKLTVADVKKEGEHFVMAADPAIRVDSRAYKMSKARGNVVNPDDVVAEYGADALRLYEMFMGPIEATKPWSMEGVNGVRNFLDRVWRLIADDRADDLVLNPAVQDVAPTADQNRMLHKTIRGVTQDIEKLFFNTAISKMMEFTNFFTKETTRPLAAMRSLVQLVSPFAPHMAEELWTLVKPKTATAGTLAYEPWPTWDDDAIREDSVEIAVQVLGKVRSRVVTPTGADEATIRAIADADPKIQELLAGKTVVKAIIVPGRLINYVVK